MASHIAELASQIKSNVSMIDSYLTRNQLPFPSFAPDGPVSLNIKSPEVEVARVSTIDALQELIDLLKGPTGCIFQENTAPLQVIAKNDVALKVPLQGQISFQDLAVQCDLQVVDFKRIIRYAIVHHRLFLETEPGYISHSAGSMLLAKDEMVRAGLKVGTTELFPSYSRTVEAMERFKDQEPNHTGFSLFHDTEQSLFDHMQSHPEKVPLFSKAMVCYSRLIPGNCEDSLFQYHGWKTLGSGTLVDVGGASGYVSYSISRAYADLKIIVQDLPHVVAAAQSSALTSNPQVTFQAHDLFTPQPAVADAYLYRWIFHDWPDHYVKRALKALVPALRTGARIIVNESLCPLPNTLPLSMERYVRYMDMLMLSVHNSRLRTVEEWQQIFKTADSRFGTIMCTQPKDSFLAILEVPWEG